MADILKFTETPLVDESIEENEYHEYDTITGTNLNNGGNIEAVSNRKTCSLILARATGYLRVV